EFKRQQAAAPSRQQSGFQATEVQAHQLPSDWQPSEDAMEILTRSGIHANFIADTIPEFVLYWRERGQSTKSWNAKFIGHIRRQWGRYTSSLEHNTEPHRIAVDWKPSEDAYDILKMATIERDFATQQVAEFVLFWRDSNQLHNSWNSKFLQHVKHQWAKRHQYGLSDDGKHQSKAGASSTRSRSITEDLTDTDW
ncbi:MAG: DnaT-like ssDNA-binding domain-containing protein, partial [Pseudomonadales bacterium]